MANPLQDVQKKHGQSIWYDNIRRKLLEDGTFQKLINDSGVVGVTSNPAIFQNAIVNSDDYDSSIAMMLDLSATEIFERLAIEDIQHAADLLSPVYEQTNGVDGYVSLEVSPDLAHQTDATLSEAKRLFEAVGRPNAMIKIPATPAGIPAIQGAIAAGVNVNITLIFSVENYVDVAEAYIKGLEQRLAEEKDVTQIASVASFFLSRIDSTVDNMLDERHPQQGKAAIASAKLAYQRFQELFYGERFAKLAAAGARVQRPLWASTSTKNPAYPDTLYVDALIGKDTVNTVPPNTLDAFRDHGTATSATILDDIDGAQGIHDQLADAGIDMAQITQKLQDDGVVAFVTAFEDLLKHVNLKRVMLKTGVAERQKYELGAYSTAVDEAGELIDEVDFNARIWKHDGQVFKDDASTVEKVENRLGWLGVLETIDIERLLALQTSVKDGDFDHVVLLGMGGSSLCPEVLSQTFGSADGFPELLMLDSTYPGQIQRIESAINIERTLFIVASKSGGTVETLSFYKYFFQQAGGNGAQFIAITDPGSKLALIAEEQGFRDLFLNPADIGGRYSALSYFGMVPAALLGIDLERFWVEATNMVTACGADIPHGYHPGIALGTAIAGLGLNGRDKICIFADPSVESFGNWVEQLVAESVGKENKGFLPVVGASVGTSGDYDEDCQFVYMKVQEDSSSEAIEVKVGALRQAGHPLVTLILPDRYALAGEFFRWEYATAVIGRSLGINPFDEPNVTESKQNTARLLDYWQEHNQLPTHEPVLAKDGVSLDVGEKTLAPLREMSMEQGLDLDDTAGLLAAQFVTAKPGDYFALLAYLSYTPEIQAGLEGVREKLRGVTKRAVTLGYGPRYLHSTGQFHKGGPNKGVFIQITADSVDDIDIPGEPYTFGVLNAAQAAGDLEALETHGCRSIRLHIHGDISTGIDKLVAAVDLVTAQQR